MTDDDHDVTNRAKRNTSNRTNMSITRFGISLDNGLLQRFDSLIAGKGYANRSEAIRDLIRGSLIKDEWQDGITETVGTITIVYSHHTTDLADHLTEVQHRFHKSVVSTMHVHLDKHNCLEVLVVKGKGQEIKKIADLLIGAKGVKHGSLVATTTGKEIA